MQKQSLLGVLASVKIEPSQMRIAKLLWIPLLLVALEIASPVKAQEAQPPGVFVIIEEHVEPRDLWARGPIANVSGVWNYGCSSTSTYIQFQPTPAHIISK